jgi:hypothetical protein
MYDFQRVKDKTTGHEYSARVPNLDKVEILADEPAVDLNGRPLPAKPDMTPVAREFNGLTVDKLNAKIIELNASRGTDSQIVPEGTKKADLVAALVAATATAAPTQISATTTAAASTTTPGGSAATPQGESA